MIKKLTTNSLCTDTIDPYRRSERFEKRDRVNWLDPVTKELKSGILLTRTHVVFEINAKDPYDPGHDVDHWPWDILGDDHCLYTFTEENLILEGKEKNA